MRVILATILGLVLGNLVNFAIINLGPEVKTPAGMSAFEAMIDAAKSYSTMDFLIPLAAHVLGLLVGLVIARFICRTSRLPIYIIGGLNFVAIGFNLFFIPAPGWFVALDLIVPFILIIFFLRLKIKK